MLLPRYAHERGHADHGWLKSAHTFSFANYYDPAHIHFSHLRVINEDWIAPNRGFGAHPHDNMEILTYVLQGRIAHQDSMGNQTEIPAGEFQIMSAGTGIIHSEMNPDSHETLHLYQIWIIPNQKNITPRYEQGRFAEQNGATLILSPTGEDNAFTIYQDMWLWRWQLTADQQANINLSPKRRYWLQMVNGTLRTHGLVLNSSDAIAISRENALLIQAEQNTEFLLFDLA